MQRIRWLGVFMISGKEVINTEEKVRKSLRYSITDGAFYSAMVGFGESFFSVFAVFMKASNLHPGLLGALPQTIGSIGAALLQHPVKDIQIKEKNRLHRSPAAGTHAHPHHARLLSRNIEGIPPSFVLRYIASLMFIPKLKERRAVEGISHRRLLLEVVTTMPTRGLVYSLITLRKKKIW